MKQTDSNMELDFFADFLVFKKTLKMHHKTTLWKKEIHS